MTRAVTPPPTDFKFAQHLIATNAGRSAKTALIDDVGALTYGELTEQIRRFAGGLKALGLKREERVLLLMQDSSAWVVAFLGSLCAGVVPVAGRPPRCGLRDGTGPGRPAAQVARCQRPGPPVRGCWPACRRSPLPSAAC